MILRNEYMKASWFQSMSLDPAINMERQTIYLTRIGILCADGFVNEGAHHLALAEALSWPDVLVVKPLPTEGVKPTESRPDAYSDLFGHEAPAAPLPREVRLQRAFDALRKEVG